MLVTFEAAAKEGCETSPPWFHFNGVTHTPTPFLF